MIIFLLLKNIDYFIDISGSLENKNGKKDLKKIDIFLNKVKNMKLKKKIPLIDQHDKFGIWGKKFGGNFVPETLKKPINDLEILFEKLRNDKKFYSRKRQIF